MRQIAIIARFEYLRHVRRRGFLMVALGVPLLMVALGGVIAVIAINSRPETALGFVDLSGRFAAADLTRVEGEPVRVPMVRYPGEADARVALQERRVTAVVIVPPDYLETGQVRVIGGRTLSERARNQVEDVLRAGLIATLPPEQQARLAEPVALTLRTLGSNRTIGGSNFFLFVLPYVLSMLFLFTAFITSGYLLQALADEKENRVMEILASTLRPTEMMAGKIVGLSGVGLTQVGAWLLWVAIAIFVIPDARDLLRDLELPWGVLALAALFFVLGYLLVAGLYATIGAAVATPQEGQQFAAPVSLLTVAPFMLLLPILAQPNGTLAVVLSLIPFTAPITMMLRLPLADIPPWQILVSLLLLALAVGGTMWLAARVMRVGMLSYGKRLSIRELLQS